jgi:hypothetical protein
MTLVTDNLKIMKSERATGGRMSGNPVVDGQTNNLFPNVATVDHWAGSVEIRKAFAFVDSNSTDELLRSFLVVTKPPTNPAATVAIFSTEDWFDFVGSHQAYLTNYLSTGQRLSWWPMGNQKKDSPILLLWGRLEATIPEAGKTYVITGDEGLPTEYSQAVQVTEVTYHTETFYDRNKDQDFNRRVALVRLAVPLRYTFAGTEPTLESPSSLNSTFRETIVADASRVYGVTALSDAISAGDYLLPVESIYAQVVPASIQETVAVDQTAAARSATLVPSAAGDVEFPFALDFGPGVNIHLGSPSAPGSVTITAGNATLTESGGQLYSGGTVIGTVDSETGIVSAVAGAPLYTGPKTVRFQPAASTAAPRQSASIAITPANRGKAFVLTLPSRPAAGSLLIAYMAGGQWYELRDNGDGTITGTNSAFGAAQLSALNTLSMSLGAPPDVGTRIMVWWGVDVYTLDRSAEVLPKAAIEITTAQAFPPGGLTLEWVVDSVAKSATDDGAGALTGDATGTVDYASKQIVMRPTVLPPKGTPITVRITPTASAVESFTDLVRNGSNQVEITLANGNVQPHSVRVRLTGLTIPYPPAYTPAPGNVVMGGGA